MNKKLIVANWKNHPDSLAEAQEILDLTNDFLGSMAEKYQFGLVYCPPFVFIEEVGRILKMSHIEGKSLLGAQDIESSDGGTVTGEITGPMLGKLGVSYVIVGHSERRWKLGESDEVVNNKLKTVLENDLIPIVCIGEISREDNYQDVLKEQISKTFQGLNSDQISKCIIAYEPVWAISTNPNARPDTPESALESITIIKNYLTTNYKLQTINYLLYGGSINSNNVESFIKKDSIDGVLIGGASVKKDEFVKILGIILKSI